MIESIKKLLPSDIGNTILCAVSGGPDSMALLFALCEIGKSDGFGVCVAHFNHCIRGEESDADERFVIEWCENHSLRVKVARADVPSIAKTQGKTLEQAARDERYAFLFKTADDFGAKYIALGHHMDDQAETVLLNLIRGSGLRGLCGMQSVNGRLLRPMLPIRRSEVLAYAVRNALPYRVDLTNLCTEYSRNLVRSLIPEFERINSGFVGAVSRTSGLLAQDEEVLRSLADNEYDRIVLDNGVDADRLLALPEAIRARILRCMAKGAGLKVDFEQRHVDEVLALCKLGTGKRIDLPHGFEARLSYGAVKIEQKPMQKEDYEIPLRQDGITETPDGRFFCELADRPLELGKNWPYEIECDPFALIGAKARGRRPGDRMWPMGAPGSKKFKDILIDHKIDRAQRSMPLLCVGDEVIWAVSLAMSENAKVTGGSTVLRVRFEPN